MRLSDIRGEKALDIMADAMELIDELGGDERFEAFVGALREAQGDRDATMRAFMRKLPPIIRDARYKKRVIAILAAASGTSYDDYAENGSTLQDLAELFLTDSAALGFFASSAAAQGSDGSRSATTGGLPAA